MYKRNAQGWSKHFDFIVVDLISLQIAFVLAVALRHHSWAYATPLYRSLGFVLFMADAVVLVLRNSMHGVVSRGYLIEAKETFKNSFYVFAIALVFMFSTQSGEAYSRIILYLVFGLHFVISYSFRLLWKWFIKKRGAGKENKRSMLVVAAPENAETILQRLGSDHLADFRITGLVLTKKAIRKASAAFQSLPRWTPQQISLFVNGSIPFISTHRLPMKKSSSCWMTVL